MSRPYAPKSFLRAVANELLQQYFDSNGVLNDFAWDALEGKNIDPLFETWLGLPDVQRDAMEADFVEIHPMATVQGFDAIVDEASWPGHCLKRPEDHDLRKRLADMASLYDRAMWTFLNRPEYWHGARLFDLADSVSNAFWVERKGMPDVDARVDAASIEELGREIGRYFHESQGRGRNCVVEPLRRLDRDYYFCSPEDFSRADPEWISGDLRRRPSHPAFNLVFIYAKSEGKLSIYVRGGKKPIPDLEAIFARIILGCDDLPSNEQDTRIYCLEQFKAGAVDFDIDDESGIEHFSVQKMRLAKRFDRRERYWLDADTSEDPDLIFEMLRKFGKGLPLDEFEVTRVEFKIVFGETRERGKRTINASVTLPNRCTLGYDGRDLIVRRILERTGIVLQEPEGDSDGDGEA